MEHQEFDRHKALQLCREEHNRVTNCPPGSTVTVEPAQWVITAVQQAYTQGRNAGYNDGLHVERPSPPATRLVVVGTVTLVEGSLPVPGLTIDHHPAHICNDHEFEALRQLNTAITSNRTDLFVEELLNVWKASTRPTCPAPHMTPYEANAIKKLNQARPIGCLVDEFVDVALAAWRTGAARRDEPATTIASLGGVTEAAAKAREATARQEGFEEGHQEGRLLAPEFGKIGHLVHALYDAAEWGFHTCESSGLDAKFRQVSRFGTLANLQAYYAAWIALMTFVHDAKAQERDDG